MADNFRKLQTEPLVVRSQHVAYSVKMVADIAHGYDQALDTDDFVLARCMLDAFYIHIRLLADFLLRPTQGRDFGPDDFGITWVAPTGEGSDRLLEAWGVASTYVVHFGGPRIPTGPEGLEPFKVGGQHFRDLAADALAIYAQFVNEVQTKAPPWNGGARIPDPDTEPDAWNARVHGDAVGILRAAQADAVATLAP